MSQGSWGGVELCKANGGYESVPTQDPDSVSLGAPDSRSAIFNEHVGELLFDTHRVAALNRQMSARSGSKYQRQASKDTHSGLQRQVSESFLGGLQRQVSGDSVSPHMNGRSPSFAVHDTIEEYEHPQDMHMGEVNADGLAESLGLGQTYRMDHMPPYDKEAFARAHASHKTIGALAATAICGNDITASCFYVVGELSKNAGIYAPVCTILSSMTLHCFRHIYGEVVTALPLNGGVYNLLLNSMSKRIASVAACLTILSYTATGVVSAVSAADYVVYCFDLNELFTILIALIILAFFAFMMLLGMQESSFIASALFLFHLATLCTLAVYSGIYIHANGLGQLHANMAWEKQPPIGKSIFFGFSSAMLGVSGFETSANFVEEQQPGVFPKTLTNMWASVSIINVVLPILSLAVLPLDDLTGAQSGYCIAYLADTVSGPGLRSLVAIDALLVLSGSVLTSYVGVTGLLLRMSGDRCLPDFFLVADNCRGTPHYSILFFFVICASMCVILQGDITMLAAIYSLAFLLVMALYAAAGLLTKVMRPTLPRPIVTHPALFVVGLCMVSSAFFAVYLLHPETLRYFITYYLLVVLMVGIAYTRVSIYTTFLWVLSRSEYAQKLLTILVRTNDPNKFIQKQIAALWNQSVVYFVKHTNISQLNRALQYIEENEEARCVRVVHIHEEDDPTPHYLIECVRLLDCVYPKIRLDCILMPGEFCPALIEHLSKSLAVPVNCMFINCPKEGCKYGLDELRGVRVILNSEKSSMLETINTSKNVMSQIRKRASVTASASGASRIHDSGSKEVRSSGSKEVPRKYSSEGE